MKPSERLSEIYEKVILERGSIFSGQEPREIGAGALMEAIGRHLDEQASKEESIVGEKCCNACFWSGKHPNKEFIESPDPQAKEKSCCKDCRGGWSDIANQFGCLKVDCTCHTPQAKEKEESKEIEICCSHNVYLDGRDANPECDCSCHKVSERNEEEVRKIKCYSCGRWNVWDTPLHPDCECGNAKYTSISNDVSERNALIDELLKDSYKLKVAVGDNPDVSDQYTLDVSNTYHSKCGFNRAVDEFMELLKSKKK